MKRNLKSVDDFEKSSPFSIGQCRWMIFQAETNGLSKAQAIVRIGRRIYIDVDAFDRWIDEQQPQQAAA